MILKAWFVHRRVEGRLGRMKFWINIPIPLKRVGYLDAEKHLPYEYSYICEVN